VEAILFLHLLWCVWVLLGWTVTRRRPLLQTLHIASLFYAIVIELVPWPPCPLTVAETWPEAHAGIEPAHGPFLVRVLDAVLYPGVPEWLVVGCAMLACVVHLCRYLRRTAGHGDRNTIPNNRTHSASRKLWVEFRRRAKGLSRSLTKRLLAVVKKALVAFGPAAKTIDNGRLNVTAGGDWNSFDILEQRLERMKESGGPGCDGENTT
jgi:hypothetical protein